MELLGNYASIKHFARSMVITFIKEEQDYIDTELNNIISYVDLDLFYEKELKQNYIIKKQKAGFIKVFFKK